MVPKTIAVDSGGVRIVCTDFGGVGSPALLLHGLYGASHEWSATAAWLVQSYHVFAVDHRGHGESRESVGNCALSELITDTISVIERLGFPVLLGQSMGGVIALAVAGCRPDLIERLVIVEATAYSSGEKSNDWLSRWPLPFDTPATAHTFFESQGLDAPTWLQILEKRDGGYWPRFDFDCVRSIACELAKYDYRRECSRIAAPTLVVAGTRSWLDVARIRETAALIKGATFVEVSDAGHDVHLDKPAAFRCAVEAFTGRDSIRDVT